jgi:hypothetical protein
MKKARPFIVTATVCFLFLLTLISGCAKRFQNNNSVLPEAWVTWPVDRVGSRTVKLHIPAGYSLNATAEAMNAQIYGAKYKHYRTQLLLETLWPDLPKRTINNHADYNVPGGGRILRVLLNSWATDFDPAKADFLHLALQADMAVSLSKLCYTSKRGVICYTVDKLDHKQEEFGLEHEGIDFNKYPGLPEDSYVLHDDIYFSPDLGSNLKTLIICTADEAKASHGVSLTPQCQHYFTYEPLNAGVVVSYRKVYLKDWKSIQQSITALLGSFIVKQ